MPLRFYHLLFLFSFPLVIFQTQVTVTSLHVPNHSTLKQEFLDVLDFGPDKSVTDALYFHQDRKNNSKQSLHNFDSASNCPESLLMAELAAIIILDLNISFLLTICSYRLLPAQRLLSSQVALSEMHDIISQL